MSDDLTERLCEEMHDRYEAAAVEAGWETQQRSRVPWVDVPEANKATMRAAVGPIADALAALTAERDAARTTVRTLLDWLAPDENVTVEVGGIHEARYEIEINQRDEVLTDIGESFATSGECDVFDQAITAALAAPTEGPTDAD